MTDEHARTGDGSPEARQSLPGDNLPDLDDGLIGRPTSPTGFILMGVGLLVLSWIIGVNAEGLGAFSVASAVGLAGTILLFIGIVATGIRVADRDREQVTAVAEQP